MDTELREYERALRLAGHDVRVIPRELLERIEHELSYRLSALESGLAHITRRGPTFARTEGRYLRDITRTRDLLTGLRAHVPLAEQDAIRTRVRDRARELARACNHNRSIPTVCPVCDRRMCDHTPAERGQTQEEMFERVCTLERPGKKCCYTQAMKEVEGAIINER